MVKNAGGNKAKRQARKYNAPATSERLRAASEEGEIYACVQKLYGNGRCGVLGVDGTEYMCRIGGKFSGRSMRDNTIAVGTWLLVGLREWESTSKNCDVLEVYSSIETKRLRLEKEEETSAAAAAAAKDIVFTDYDPVAAAAAAAAIFTEDDLEYETATATAAAADNYEMVNIDDI